MGNDEKGLTEKELEAFTAIFSYCVESKRKKIKPVKFDLVPTYYFNEHLQRIQTTWLEPKTLVKRWNSQGKMVELEVSFILHNEFEWLMANQANYTKQFYYFTGKK